MAKACQKPSHQKLYPLSSTCSVLTSFPLLSFSHSLPSNPLSPLFFLPHLLLPRSNLRTLTIPPLIAALIPRPPPWPLRLHNASYHTHRLKVRRHNATWHWILSLWLLATPKPWRPPRRMKLRGTRWSENRVLRPEMHPKLHKIYCVLFRGKFSKGKSKWILKKRLVERSQSHPCVQMREGVNWKMLEFKSKPNQRSGASGSVCCCLVCPELKDLSSPPHWCSLVIQFLGYFQVGKDK